MHSLIRFLTDLSLLLSPSVTKAFFRILGCARITLHTDVFVLDVSSNWNALFLYVSMA